jgi:hypothetical protein
MPYEAAAPGRSRRCCSLVVLPNRHGRVCAVGLGAVLEWLRVEVASRTATWPQVNRDRLQPEELLDWPANHALIGSAEPLVRKKGMSKGWMGRAARRAFTDPSDQMNQLDPEASVRWRLRPGV